MINRPLSLFLLILLFSANMRAFGQNCVYLYLKDHTRIEFSVADKPILTYVENNIRIKSATLDLEYAGSEIAGVSLDDKPEINRIEKMQDVQEPQINIKNGNILFIGFPASSLVNVYTLSGQRYAVYSIDETGCLTIPFDDYPAGTYLFNVNQISYKLIKK